MVREISWTNNLTTLSRAKTIEEKEFYLKLCVQERYTTRELEWQINSSFFERVMLGNTKLSAVLREIHPNSINSFKEYKTQLPDKKLLQQKIHELFENSKNLENEI
jgi:predicted nuclease of restriction endonuclease-like (RecB) superfamily